MRQWNVCFHCCLYSSMATLQYGARPPVINAPFLLRQVAQPPQHRLNQGCWRKRAPQRLRRMGGITAVQGGRF